MSDTKMRKRKNKPDSAGQLEAARIIAGDPLRYPGVMQTWAKLFLQKQDSEAYKHQDPEDDGKIPW